MSRSKRITLQQAIKRFPIEGLDLKALKGQEGAFAACLDFLAGIEPIRSFNRSHTSYGLKHIVENPAGRLGIPSDSDAYFGYVYEGTLVLAALAAGFERKATGSGITSVFNISERGLKRRAKEVVFERCS